MSTQEQETPAVHITFLLDKSGSMQSVREDVIGGWNAFLAEQKALEGDCRLTMIQFDSQGYEYAYMAEDITNVKEMQSSDFQPRGGTPLYDAIGRAIGDADTRLKAKVNPETQLFVILTDGYENSSHNFTREEIFVKIEERQGQGWTFTYLGANQDAYAAGAGIGIQGGSTQSFAGSSAGTYAAFTSVSANTAGLRSATYAGATPDVHAFYATAGKEAEDKQKAEEAYEKAMANKKDKMKP